MKIFALWFVQFYGVMLSVTFAAFVVMNWHSYVRVGELFAHGLGHGAVWPVTLLQWVTAI